MKDKSKEWHDQAAIVEEENKYRVPGTLGDKSKLDETSILLTDVDCKALKLPGDDDLDGDDDLLIYG